MNNADIEKPILYIHPLNETHVQLDGDRAIIMDLYDFMSFKVQGAEWSEAYKNKLWDGMSHLLSPTTNKIYKGLIPYIETFAENRGWCVKKDPNLNPSLKNFNSKEFIAELHTTFPPFDFQEDYIQHAIDNDRACIVSPTSSGKSFIIYCLVRYYLKEMYLEENKKILITEPTTKLVKQMLADWKSYDPVFPIERLVHSIYDGAEKTTNKPVILSTWQALQGQNRKFMSQFGMIGIDEAHGIKANEVKALLEKAIDCKFRFGFTGTLDESQCNRFVIEGLTGPAIQFVKTKDLMDRGIVSKLEIKSLLLTYSKEVREQNKKFKWQDERDFIVHHNPRNEFIANLVSTITDGENTLILTEYHNKKKHCDILAAAIKKKCPNKKIIIVNGSTKEDYEQFRKYVEENSNIVIIATFGVFSTGISINNIQNIVFATFSKSVIKVLQSIGRGLRRDGKLNLVTVFDIVDDFGFKKNNYLVAHFIERMRIYLKEGFSNKSIRINI